MIVATLASLLVAASISTGPTPHSGAVSFARVDGTTGGQAITQTPDGWLWFAGPGGLERYDGRKLTPVPGPWNDELVRQLHATADGSLWVVTGRAEAVVESEPMHVNWSSRPNAVYRGHVSAGNVRDWRRVEDLEAWTLAPAPDGGVVVSTKSGLYRLSPDLRKVRLPLPPGEGVALALAFETKGTLLAGGPWGLWRYQGTDAPQRILAEPVATLSVDAGRIVVGAKNNVRVLGTDGSLATATATVLLADSAGVWAVAGWGLARLSDGNRNDVPWFAGKVVRALFRDREDTLWVGTWGTGFFHNVPHLVSVPALGQASSAAAFSVLAARDGTLWTTSTAGLDGIAPDGSHRNIPLERLNAWSPRGLAELTAPWPQGTLLIAAEGFGVVRGDGQTFARHTPWWGGKPADVLMVFAMQEGGAAIGFRGGGVRIESRADLAGARPFDAGLDLDTSSGLCAGDVSAAATTIDGSTWFAHATGGLSTWNGTSAHCLSSGLPGSEAVSLLADPKGGVWVGFGDPVGMAHVEASKVSLIPASSGIGRVFGMAYDLQDRMWLTSDVGVKVVRASDLYQALQNPAANLPALRIGLSDGLPSEDCVARFSPSIARMADGRIAVPTLSGLALLDPSLPRQRPALTTVIERVRIRGKEVEPQTEFHLGVGDAPIDLSFTAPTSLRPEGLRFEYQEGPETPWTLMEIGRTFHLAALEPGTHRLRARAVDEMGSALGPSAQITLHVRPPWWRHPVSLAATAILLVALGMGVFQIRMHQFKLRVRAVNRERQRLSRELHDGLAQGFTSIGIHLAAIANRAAREAPVLVSPLEQTQQVVAECSTQARNAIWNLRTLSANMSLADAVEAAINRANAGDTSLTFVVTGRALSTSAEVLYELPLVAQEAVVNAIKHGQAAHIEVSLSQEANVVRLLVNDDGLGFTPHGTAVARDGHGFGITGMKERVARLAGTFSLSSEPGHGTRVQVEVPQNAAVSSESDRISLAD